MVSKGDEKLTGRTMTAICQLGDEEGSLNDRVVDRKITCLQD